MLKLTNHYVESSFRLFNLAVEHNFVQGRKTIHIVAACVYIVCRQERSPVMLIDLSDVLRVNVFDLGRTFVKLYHLLNLNRALPIIDPALFIQRYAGRLELGEKTHAVCSLAIKIIAQMNRDWIQMGRRPAGICAVALQVACNTHGVNRSREDIRRILRVSETTLMQRMREFEQTPAALTSVQQFSTAPAGGDISREGLDPPSFINNRITDGSLVKAAALGVSPELDTFLMSHLSGGLNSSSKSNEHMLCDEDKNSPVFPLPQVKRQQPTREAKRRIKVAVNATTSRSNKQKAKSVDDRPQPNILCNDDATSNMKEGGSVGKLQWGKTEGMKVVDSLEALNVNDGSALARNIIARRLVQQQRRLSNNANRIFSREAESMYKDLHDELQEDGDGEMVGEKTGREQQHMQQQRDGVMKKGGADIEQQLDNDDERVKKDSEKPQDEEEEGGGVTSVTPTATVVNNEEEKNSEKEGGAENSNNNEEYNEDDTFSDLDDQEIDEFLMTDAEVSKKTAIWTELNKVFLTEQEAKKRVQEEADAQAAKEAAENAVAGTLGVGSSFSGNGMVETSSASKKRKRKNAASVRGGAAAAAAAAAEQGNGGVLCSRNSRAPRETAAQGLKDMITRHKVSRKINYEALRGMFDESGTLTASSSSFAASSGGTAATLQQESSMSSQRKSKMPSLLFSSYSAAAANQRKRIQMQQELEAPS